MAQVALEPTSRTVRLARALFATTGVLALGAVVLNLFLAAGEVEGRFGSPAGRVVNSLSFFTTQSNILVGVTTGLLAVRMDRGPVFRSLRLSGVLSIVVVGVVYHLQLRGLNELTGLSVLTDLVTHTLVPILTPLGWLLLGPRGGLDRRVVVGTVAFPTAWLAYSLVRGEVVVDRMGAAFYPYPFLDVGVIGYAPALRNVGAIALAFLAMAAAAAWSDPRLPGIARARRP